MDKNLENQEHLCALADGELLEADLDTTMAWLADNAAARTSWTTYHLVGEVLRSGTHVRSDRDAAFLTRIRAALEIEREQSAQQSAIEMGSDNARPAAAAAEIHVKVAANDAYFHWHLLGGLAALMLALVIGWQGLGAWIALEATPQVAQVIVPVRESAASLPMVVAREESAVMIRDPQLDALLAAHKQFGGTSAFQKPSGFLSNAVFEGASQ